MHRLTDVTSPEFTRLLTSAPGVIIPFGTLEAHGPHLPLATDTFQAEAVAAGVAERLGLLLAPPIHYGVCLSTRDHAGSVSIGTATLKALTMDIVRSLARQGCRTFVLLSGHAGGTHVAALRDAAETLLDEDPARRFAVISEYDLLRQMGTDLVETADDRHAGEIETSRLLHLRPELVRGTAPEEYPRFTPGLHTADKVARWPGSVWGNPAAATPEKGRQLFERAVDAVAAIVTELVKSEPGAPAAVDAAVTFRPE